MNLLSEEQRNFLMSDKGKDTRKFIDIMLILEVIIICLLPIACTIAEILEK